MQEEEEGGGAFSYRDRVKRVSVMGPTPRRRQLQRALGVWVVRAPVMVPMCTQYDR